MSFGNLYIVKGNNTSVEDVKSVAITDIIERSATRIIEGRSKIFDTYYIDEYPFKIDIDNSKFSAHHKNTDTHYYISVAEHDAKTYYKLKLAILDER